MLEGSVPDDFVLSQSNLQMFVDCKRRFFLTHIARLPWPALEASPLAEYEAAMRRGELFHLLVQRATEGVAVESDLLAEPLRGWVEAWQSDGLEGVPRSARLTEYLLESTLAPADEDEESAHRLVAKFDLLAADADGKVMIVDWKTNAHAPTVEQLRTRLQSVIYPFVLVEASPNLPFGIVDPDQVVMRYWYAGAPDSLRILRYSRDQHEANRLLLRETLADLRSRAGEEAFPKVADTEANRRRLCNFCIYRSRCERGSAPGDVDDHDDVDDEGAIDLGDVAEVIESWSIEDITELAF